jgi:hypothetical protein
MIKSRWAFFLLTGVLLAGLGAAVGVPDLLASAVFTRALGTPLRFKEVRLTHWSSIQFQSLEIQGFRGTYALSGGAGRVIFLEKGRRLQWNLSDLKVPYEIIHAIPMVAGLMASPAGAVFSMDEVKLCVKKSTGQVTTYHILNARSKTIRVRGGVRMDGRRFQKAHFLVMCSNDFFENLPRQLRANMIRKPDDWKGLRMVLFGDELTLIGPRGPIFKAQWTFR